MIDTQYGTRTRCAGYNGLKVIRLKRIFTEYIRIHWSINIIIGQVNHWAAAEESTCDVASTEIKKLGWTSPVTEIKKRGSPTGDVVVTGSEIEWLASPTGIASRATEWVASPTSIASGVAEGSIADRRSQSGERDRGADGHSVMADRNLFSRQDSNTKNICNSSIKFYRAAVGKN
ncbi:hypothetical protein HK097_005968 [Rhizophlyctis rosea]|uniref:Uncharacterized protein n=1 Tax=Rhizophlyctis rosea TaxID=64517 RepID=A0AAD5SJ53_9FUNG|nr:hypothetical protein HK097_005968 [Rhizophlyctis rosea]